jgi:4-amino-4-deoxy-L-arabinose transferase-like glycosyltransferase
MRAAIAARPSGPPVYPPRPRWPVRWALLAILLAAFALRFYRLDASSLWSDEGNTWALMERSVAQIGRDAAADIHPPGYYWLLKAWAGLSGDSAFVLRAFSAFAGVLLVVVIYRIGRLAFATTPSRLTTALLAALLAALNPFEIYYSQEARMYMLLALAGAFLFWSLFAWLRAEEARQPWLLPFAGYVASGILGLWTHYSFPILLTSAALAYLVRRLRMSQGRRGTNLLRFALANLLILLVFAPWLPIALRRVLAWPSGGVAVAWAEGLRLTVQTLSAGPIRNLPDGLWPWLWAAALLPLLGLLALRRSPSALTLALWLLAPVGLMAGLGLFTDAFLKFLLTASPAWCLLAAAAPDILPLTWRLPTGVVQTFIAAVAVAFALLTLPVYYQDPAARDNYAGVARYIRALGDPEMDLVVLDAPGQQEVWRYYGNAGLPALALPASRPPDPAQTVNDLAAAVGGRSQVYALFWATGEADPDRLVESWLDHNAFKGLESWQGNLRFAVYSLPNRLTCRPMQPPPTFGAVIVLAEQCQPDAQAVAAGETALVGLRWRATAALDRRYKVTVQLLDARSQVIAQRDGEPAGGSQPTDNWQPQEIIVDNHGLTIPPGVPPGDYRLIVALYDAETGLRLPVSSGGDAIELGNVQIVYPSRPLPVEIIDIPHRTGVDLGAVHLVGYAAHRKDFSHAPETPVQPGDLVHFTFFWQAPDPLPPDWPADATFTLKLGTQSLAAPLAGDAYPTSSWRAGELVRGEFDLLYDGGSATPVLRVGDDSIRLASLPH